MRLVEWAHDRSPASGMAGAAGISTPVGRAQAYNISALEAKVTLPMHIMTDCRSLYDCIIKKSPMSTEKRTLIDVLSLKQTLASGGLRWCPTTEQLADGLTKVDMKLMLKLTMELASGVETACSY